MPSIRVLTVGASLSLSGRFAVQGRQAYQGMMLWADDVNRAGGLTVRPSEPPLQVRLIIYDDASRHANAAANTERLIFEDGVHLLLGPYSSVLALAAAEAAAHHDRTIWNHGGSSDAMDARGWQHVVTLLSSASRYFEPLLEMAAQQDGRPIRTVALLRGAQGTFPAAVIGGARDHARRLGLGIVFDGMYPEVRHTAPSPQPPCEEEGVHSVLVRQLADLAPDLILGAGTTEADVAFALEIRRQGVNSALIGLVAAGVQAFWEALGADADGICGPSQWEPTAAAQPDIGPSSAAFARSYRARFRAEPDYPAAQAYAAGLIAAHCAQAAGSLDDLAIRQAAFTLDLTTFYGRFRLAPDTRQQTGHQVVVVQWHDGQKQVVWPRDAAMVVQVT